MDEPRPMDACTVIGRVMMVACPACDSTHYEICPARLAMQTALDSARTAADAAEYERGVRDASAAGAVVVDALATRLATTVHECAHELGLACAVCDASREVHATVSALRARGAAQPPVQGDGKGGA